MEEILELETRRKIHDLISKNPGLHLSKIAEILKMGTSLVDYHLIYLEKNEIVNFVKESGYVRYYIKGKIGFEDKKILSILRQEIPLKIILYLLKTKILQHKEILQNLNIAPSTLSYHLKKLLKLNIIRVETYGGDKGYCVIDKKLIVSVLIQYKPYNLFESFNDIWIDFSV